MCVGGGAKEGGKGVEGDDFSTMRIVTSHDHGGLANRISYLQAHIRIGIFSAQVDRNMSWGAKPCFSAPGSQFMTPFIPYH